MTCGPIRPSGVTGTFARKTATSAAKRTARTKMIELTSVEAECLANHLEYYIIQEIKDDEDYDSIDYLCTLTSIYQKCKEVKNDTCG